MGESKRHLRYWIYSKKSLFGIIFGRDQSCCDLWSGDMYFSKATDTPCPDPQTWPRSCWKHAAIAVKSNTPPQLRIHPLSTVKKRAKEALLWKRLEESIIHNMIQPLLQMQGRHHGCDGGGGGLTKAMLFRVHLAMNMLTLRTGLPFKGHLK